MVRRYTGGFISAKEQASDSNTANGVFTLSEHQERTALGNFPTGRWTPSRSLRCRASASAYLSRTPSVASGQDKWTLSTWVKRGLNGAAQHIIGGNTTTSGGTRNVLMVEFGGDNAFWVYGFTNASGYYFQRTSNQIFRDPAAWYHVVVQFDPDNAVSANKVIVYVNGQLLTWATSSDSGAAGNISSTAYRSINNTNRNDINGGYQGGGVPIYFGDGYLSEMYMVSGSLVAPSDFATTDPETGTWVPKQYNGAYGTNGFYLPFSNNGTTTALGLDMSPSKNMLTYSEQMDNAAWSKTNLNVTANTANDPLTSTLTVDKLIPTTTNGEHTINQGATVTSSTYYTYSVYAKADGYNYIQTNESAVTNAQAVFDLSAGTAATATSNNQSLHDATSRIQSVGNGWYRCSVTYKTGSAQTGMTFNTYILNNSAASSYAGNGTSGVLFWGAMINVGTTANTYVTSVASAVVNNWTANNFSVTAGTTYDSMVDVPGIAAVAAQNDVGGVVRGNYATLNPLALGSTGTSVLSNGNLSFVNSSQHASTTSTIGVSSGKWYWEGTITSSSAGGWGFTSSTAPYSAYPGEVAGLWWIYDNTGTFNINNQATTTFSGSSKTTTGAVWQIALDMDNGKAWFGINNVWYDSAGGTTGNPLTGANPTWSSLPLGTTMHAFFECAGQAWAANFGQRPFTYTPPAGFKSLCTSNLPNPIIKRPSEHFDVKTWVGNGNSQTIGTTNKQTSSYQISRSLRFRKANSAFLSRVPATTGSQTTWTWSGWVKQTQFGTSGTQWLLTSGNSGSISTNYTALSFSAQGFLGNTNQLQFYSTLANSSVFALASNARFESNTGWYHVVAVIDTTQTVPSERIKLYVNGVRITQWASTTFPSLNATIPFVNSSAFETRIGGIVTYGSYDGYMTEINFVDGQALTPASFGQFDANNNWVPTRYAGTYGTNGYYLPFSNNSSLDTLGFDRSSSSAELITNGSFHTNVSGWTVGAAVSGSPSITLVSGAARIANSANNGVMYYQAIPTTIGTTYYAQCNVSNISIGGSSRIVALQKSDNTSNNLNLVTLATRTQADGNGSLRGTFTATATTTYIFINADILGTGTQGADFDNISVSEVAYKNNWNLNNFSTTAGITYDSMLDSPTDYDDGSGNIRGNHAVLNSLENVNTTYLGFQNGSLRANMGTGAGTMAWANMAMPPLGKWYWEVTVSAVGNGTSIGISYGASTTTDGNAKSITYSFSANKRVLTVDTAYGATYTTGDIIGVAVDKAASTITFYKNNVSQGVITEATIATQDYRPFLHNNTSSGSSFLDINFGQQPFVYTPPAGYKSLNTKNLKDVGSFNLPDTFGNYVNTPDLIWIKNRSNTYNHIIQDTVRGTGLYSDITAGTQQPATTSVQAFLPNGFQIGSIAGGNGNGESIVGWTWNRGQIPGFDIVNYAGDGVAGRKVPHNLGVPPKFIIAKNLNSSVNWMVGHNSVGWTHKIEGLNTTTGSAASSLVWNNTAPSSTDITLGSDFNINSLGYSFIAYIWAEVPGFSKFDKYTGNGATDGPYVYTGFRPRWVMIKRTDAVNDWIIYDTHRQKFNTGTADATVFLRANSTAVEDTDPVIDAMASGFKVNGTAAFHNASGGTYIYAAFAEAPFKYANAR